MLRQLCIASLLIWGTVFDSNLLAAQETEEVTPKKKTTEIFELEFIPKADLYRTANYLRGQGFNALVTDLSDAILIESDSYTKALDKLQKIVPNLPDISRFSWVTGSTEVVLYQSQEADLFIKDRDITEDMKVLNGRNGTINVTIILRDDKQILTRYESIVKQIESQGFKIVEASGIVNFGWLEHPALTIEVENKISTLKKAIYSISEISEVSHFMYNRGRAPHMNDYTLSFTNDVNLDLQISRLLANGVEVYKIDFLLNRLFIHFPNSEVRNNIKLEQIRQFDDLIVIKDIHRNKEWFNPEYRRNVQHIWLDIPEEVLKGKNNQAEYLKNLNQLSRIEVAKLREKGLVVINHGVYTEVSDVLIPEIVVTYRDSDKSKAREALKFYNLEAKLSIKPALKGGRCATLFSK